MKVIVSEFMDASALDGFGSQFDVTYEPNLVDNRDKLLSLLTDADAVIVRNRTQVDQEMLDRAPKLRAVGRLGVGLDNIDMAACAARDVSVHPAVGANAEAVAEYVITSALVLGRGAFFANSRMIAGEWPRGALMGSEVGGLTLGLYGFGNIARVTAQKARALGMTVLATDPHLDAADPAWEGIENVARDDLLIRSDVLSLHLPLTDETRGLLNAEALGQMKPSAILVNTARGGIVDESALATALKDGALRGAALDVFEDEPLTTAAAEKFRDVPNLILTPHIAGVTEQANVRVSHVTVRNVREALLS